MDQESQALGGHVCCIVPPHLLRAISNSSECDQRIRASAAATLEHTLALHQRRRQYSGPGGQGIVPSSILSSMSSSDQVDENNQGSARKTLLHDQDLRKRRTDTAAAAADTSTATVDRHIYDAKHTEDQQALPGTLLREEGQPSTTSNDKDVNSCYDNFGYTFDLYKEIFGRISIDNKDLPLIGSVHYSTDYANAFWDGQQMVFGDGNDFLYMFCQSLDVIGHELTHGVTQYTCQLAYADQAGALNESISDVFGSLVKQYHLKETAEQADWLIGEGCLFPGVKGVALRSMKAPGTAYNDPKIGKDQQVGDMANYIDTQEDNGGVHLNSGIPNRAFYLAATGFGGNAWEKAGKVWYGTITSGKVRQTSDFAAFANVTLSVAQELFGDDGQGIVRKAWQTVGVL